MERKKILIVDDEEEVLLLLEKYLVREGYDVITAATGREAVIKARSLSPHLILMDIVLPDIDGPEVVKKLQEKHETSKIPVIFLSGIVSKEEGKEPDIKVGNDEYDAMGKPFLVKDLLKKIETAIS